MQLTIAQRLTEALQAVADYVNAAEDIASWDQAEILAKLLDVQLVIDSDVRETPEPA
jgi:hypothetical protein